MPVIVHYKNAFDDYLTKQNIELQKKIAKCPFGLDKSVKVMGVLFHISLLLCDFPVSTLRNLSILYHNIAASVETLVSPLVFNTL